LNIFRFGHIIAAKGTARFPGIEMGTGSAEARHMFQPTLRKSNVGGLIATLELIFHVAVRDIRMSSSNALIGLIVTVLQSTIMLGTFWFMNNVLGMRGSAVRGDYLLYMMSGIFIYMTHVKTMRAIAKSDGPTSAMMKHAPMNTVVSISGQALATLYQQVLAIIVILFIYNTVAKRIEIEFPVAAFGMLILAWISGIGVGMIFKAATPWAPEFFRVATSVYAAVNMIASGKMFLVNTLPPRTRFWFSWNPLFHLIDQTRGFVFLNYNPHYTSITYAAIVCAVLLFFGLLGDSFTKQYASASWAAGK
jgi:ABC-type polysaccharide/polyol phosphate export permease